MEGDDEVAEGVDELARVRVRASEVGVEDRATSTPSARGSLVLRGRCCAR
ncbi:hypothetical protein Q760_08025 [Cellulomonas cellasea DSM 20118]|uniref:Uncharacterized protein n=1 Tax=Cellulomonas cellasea DSM 20118 TaxID=1408250 RepID=A0A0A0BAP1_9CELL|nr:hypothetical protein Q760_08025 [Cellulomonas cellasea DSM 20118]